MEIKFATAAIAVLFCVAGLHAVAVVSGTYAIHNTSPAWVDQLPSDKADVPAAGIDFDRMTYGSSSVGSSSRVNAQARDEVKRQQCVGGNCTTQSPVPLAPGERYVPGSLRVVPSKPPTSTPTPTNATPAKSVPPSKALYQIAVFTDGSGVANELIRAFETDAGLAKLKSRCGFQIYDRANAIYRTRYASIMPESYWPAILFTAPDGGLIHAASITRADISTLYATLESAHRTYTAVQQQAATRQSIDLIEQCPDGVCPLPARDGILPLRRDEPVDSQSWFRMERIGWTDQLASLIKLVLVLAALIIVAAYLFRKQ